MTALLARLNPAVPRGALAPLAAVAWGAVGIMLLRRSLPWFLDAPGTDALLPAAFGLVMAGGMVFGMFPRIVGRNMERLARRPERACLFSVFAWRSWAMVVVMSVGGVTLRNSDVPRLWLAGPYLGMGLSLLSGAVLYLRAIRAERTS